MLHQLKRTLGVFFNFDKRVYKILTATDKILIKRFFKHTIPQNTVLIADVFNYHGEILPGLVDYCQKLGYKVDVLITENKLMEKPLDMHKNINIFSAPIYLFKEIFKQKVINQYERIIFATARLYYEFDKNKPITTTKYLNYKSYTKKPISLEHHFEAIDEEELLTNDVIGLPKFSGDFGIKMVNTHYFGKVKRHKKNNKVRFIVMGNISKTCKNHNLLLTAVENLLKNKVKNFEIIVIGRGKLTIKDKKIASKIKLLGRVTYKKMYEEIAKSDYILGLLDSTNIEHDRYITCGTSGTFQLVYGFKKPCIIDEHFAHRHNFNESNSIIYNGNNEFTNALENAISLNNEQYDKLVDNIETLSKQIYNESLLNLKELLEK